MTRIRSELVCEESLYRVAQSLELGRLMRLGRGEEKSGGRGRVSVLADLVEALIAAIYLDSGLENAGQFIDRFVLCDAERQVQARNMDNKTALQELVQHEPGSRVEYRLVDEKGPDHDKRFEIAVFVNGELAGSGMGKSKKDAEQAAAGAALENAKG